jgi:Enoyl-CoA hydratase/isomerase
MTDKMLARKDGRVGTMTFNNPERHNAVSFDMWQAASNILDDFARDEEVRVVVLTGAGGKAFVSGADISKFEDERATREAVEKYNAAVERFFSTVYVFPKPTIAAIQGYCIGGGLGLAVTCDLRFCTQSSRFALPAARLGLGYGFNGLQRFVNTIGPSHTKDIFFSARQFGRRGPEDGHRQPCIAGRRVGGIREGLCRYRRRQRAADGQRHQADHHRGLEARERTRPGPGRGAGRALLRQPGLHRGPHRLPGEAQAEFHGEIALLSSRPERSSEPGPRAARIRRVALGPGYSLARISG